MGKRLINVDEVEEIVPVLVGKLLENNLITDQIICAIFNDNDRLNEIRELNPDYDISMHKLNVCVGDSQYRLVYCIYVEHKESGISVYRDKDFDVQEVINRLPSKFTIEKEQELLPKGVNIKIHKYSINCVAYMDDKSIILGRGIENHCNEDGTRRVKDTIHIPMSLVASFGSFD